MKIKDWMVTAGLLALGYRLVAFFRKPETAVMVPVPLRQTVPVVVRSFRRERRQYRLLIQFFIASEAFFFLALIVSYVYYRNLDNTMAESRHFLDAQKTGLYTLALIASSGTLWWGHRALRQGKPHLLILGLLATLVLGAVFLYGQGSEYAHLIGQQMTISTNIFGSAFFTLTGFHALHVFIGLLVLSMVLLLALVGDYQGPRSSAVASTELYWHFVDVVWIVVFTVVYLIPLV